MKKLVLYSLLALGLFFLPAAARSDQPVSLEILYLNHGPLQSTLKQIRAICGGYGKAITVAWYDAESPEGEKFMAQKGIHEHTPLAVWIDGKTTVKVQGKDIQFVGFPTGAGPAFFQGKWTMEDLRGALNLATGKK